MKTQAVQKAENRDKASLMSHAEKEVMHKSAHESYYGLNKVDYSFGRVRVHCDKMHSNIPLMIQPKLKINRPGDEYEREADAMAERVTRMPMHRNTERSLHYGSDIVQRKCMKCEEKKDERQKGVIMRKTDSHSVFDTPLELDSQLSRIKGGGIPLPESTQYFMEDAFKTDFSKVRVHTNNTAIEMNKSINAKAFTHGTDIYFNQGEYNVESEYGRNLLAHELTHVVQQRSFTTPQKIQARRWGSCPRSYNGRRLQRQDARAYFINFPAELFAVLEYIRQYSPRGHCIITNEMLASGTMPTCRTPLERRMVQQIYRSFHRSRSPGRRGSVQSTDEVQERPEGAGGALERAVEFVQTLLQPDIIDLTSLEVYDVTTDRQAPAKRTLIQTRYLPILRSITGRSWDAGRAMQRPPVIVFPIVPTENVVCFGSTDFARFPGVIQYIPFGSPSRRRRGRRRRGARSGTRSTRGTRRRGTRSGTRPTRGTRSSTRSTRSARPRSGSGASIPTPGNFGFGLSIMSGGTGAGNAGIGVSIMSNGVSVGTVSAGVVYNSDGVQVASVGVGVAENNIGAAAGVAGAGTASGSAIAGTGIIGSGSAEELVGTGAGIVASGDISGPSTSRGDTTETGETEGSETEETTIEEQRTGDESAATGSQEGEGVEQGDRTARSDNILGIPGLSGSEVNQAVRNAADIDGMLNQASPAQMQLFRQIIQSSPNAQYLIPAARWIEQMMYATEGITDEEATFLATLEWTPADVDREVLRASVHAALRERETSRTDEETVAGRERIEQGDSRSTTNLAEDPRIRGVLLSRDDRTGRLNIDQEDLELIRQPDFRIHFLDGRVRARVVSVDISLEDQTFNETHIQILSYSVSVEVTEVADDITQYSVGDVFTHNPPREVYEPTRREFIASIVTPGYYLLLVELTEIRNRTLSLRTGVAGAIRNLGPFSAQIIRLENTTGESAEGQQTYSGTIVLRVTQITNVLEASYSDDHGSLHTMQVGEIVRLPISK